MKPWTDDDVDVLIDMLDDPLRRWFAAWELYRVLGKRGPKLKALRRERIAEEVGIERHSTISQITEQLLSIWGDEVPLRLDEGTLTSTGSPVEPRPFWQVGPYLFDSLEASEIYADLKSWRSCVRGGKDPAVPLDCLLDRLLNHVFIDRIVPLREGREEKSFEADPLIRGITTAIRKTSNASEIVEKWLDKTFRNTTKMGEAFAQTEAVMGLLFALKKSNSSMFSDIAEVFARSTAAEFSLLRRFSKRLLADETVE